MKNTENAAMPISAIVYWRFLPRRRSGNPVQASHTRDIKPSSVPTRSLNQLRPDSNTAEMRADSICRTFQLKIPKMRIAGLNAGGLDEATTSQSLHSVVRRTLQAFVAHPREFRLRDQQ